MFPPFVSLAESNIEFKPREVILSLLVTVAVFALAALGRFILRDPPQKAEAPLTDSA